MKKTVWLAVSLFLCAGVQAQETTNEFNYFTSLTLSVPMKNHLGPVLVKADGSTVPSETLNGKVVGLFFSASWNDSYIDQLKTLYAALKKEGKPFEIVWVSNDVTKDGMMKFMREKQIPWLAVAFDRLSVLNLRFQYNVRFDPTLLIINSPGSVFSEEGLKDISVFGGEEAFAKWLELRPIPFQGQSDIAQYPPKAPVNKDPMALDDLLEQRGSMAGDVVEMLFNEVISIEMVDNTTYRARVRCREGDVTTGETVISFPAEGYSFFKKLLGQGELRRTVYVQVSHPGFPLRVLGNDYSKKHNEYSWED
jgi:hypothetical protein